MPVVANTTLRNEILLASPPCWEIKLGTLTKYFFNCLLGTWLRTYTKNFSHSTQESQRPLKIKGPQSLLQPPYHLPITDALTAIIVVILALAHYHICNAPNDVTWVSYCLCYNAQSQYVPQSVTARRFFSFFLITWLHHRSTDGIATDTSLLCFLPKLLFLLLWSLCYSPTKLTYINRYDMFVVL